MSDLMDQALLLQLRQRPRESASSRLAQYLLQQAGRQGPVYGTLGVLSTAAQPMLAAWLARRGEEREREAEREAFDQIREIERQRAQEADAFWRGGMTPQQPTMPQQQMPAQAAAPQGDWLDRLERAESGGDPNARNPRSSATGAFQFIDDTWRAFARANPERFSGMTDEQILAARTDPALSREAAQWYARENARILEAANLPPTPANLALAHRFGGNGAVSILRADPNSLVVDVVPNGARVLEANPDLRGRTAAQVIQDYNRLVSGAQASPAMPATPNVQPAPMPQTIPAAQGVLPSGVTPAPMPETIPALPQGVTPPGVTPVPMPNTIPAAQGVIPGSAPRQMPETIPGLPPGITPAMIAEGLAHPNPAVRQRAAAYAQAAQLFQRQTPNLTSVAPGNFIIDPRTGQVIGQVPQLPSETERLLAQWRILRSLGEDATPEQREERDMLKERLRQAGIRVDVRNDGPIPPGWQAIRDPETGNIVALREIPGGPAEQQRLEREERQRLQQEFRQLQTRIVTDDIDRALAIIERTFAGTAGFGALTLAQIGGTPARNVQALLDGIRANIGFDQLNRMREASPTGGALGNVTERELAFLQAVGGSLDQGQTPEQLSYNLNRLKNNLQLVLSIMARVLHSEAGQAPTGAAAQPTQPQRQNAVPPIPEGAERVIAPPRGR